MMVLKNILYKVSIEKVLGSTDTMISEVVFDSRKVSEGDVFVAISGSVVNGHDYIQVAEEKKASVIICEKMPTALKAGVVYVQVQDSKEALAIIASNYYGVPSENLKLVGVTGTNGKTTIASLLYALFQKAGYKVGLLSTIKIMVDQVTYQATHTTPDPLVINKYLKEMNDVGVVYCFMEVSSHGIHQKRIEGLHFSGGVFTNLTHDHLDYHTSFQAYRDVKKCFFDKLPKTAFSLVNKDDKNGDFMLQNTVSTTYGYALKSYADFMGKVMEKSLNGLLLKINDQEVWSKLIGNFNAYNLLAIFGTAKLLGLPSIEILRLISTLESVEGRFQHLISNNNIVAIVDYAHTPDALKNVLETINDIRTNNESLLTVVGCGGDRDKSKRPVMGRIAAALSSKVILTSDNPRSENPEVIIQEMEAGIDAKFYNKILSISDRKQAIKTACQLANTNDIILIAGKGHETYQEVKGERVKFDDFEIIKEELIKLKK